MVDGYSRSGVSGAVAGIGVGASIGTIGGAALLLGGVSTCLWQLSTGVLRTPSAIYAACTGLDWDPDTAEFGQYDLELDAKRTLISEEEFLIAYNDSGGSLHAVFKEDSTREAAIKQGQGQRVRDEFVADTSLYDILGIATNANPSEIKRAYYFKARQCHPDRNPEDPNASKKFQAIGEAYHVLSDDRLRAQYNAGGKETVQGAAKLDANILYAIIFGSDKFDRIIGELQLTSLLRNLAENSSGYSSILNMFRQRRREVQCAVDLASKLDVFVNGDRQRFFSSIDSEVLELSECPLGAVLLSLVGRTYEEFALAEGGLLDAAIISIRSQLREYSDACVTMSSASQAVISAIHFHRVSQGAYSHNGHTFEIHPNISSDERKQFVESSKIMGENMLHLFWQLTKLDIIHTIKNICRKVLHDSSQESAHLEKRRLALLEIGSKYQNSLSTSAEDALNDLLNKLGVQSGLFGGREHGPGPGQEAEAEASASPEQPKSDPKVATLNADHMDLWNKMEILSVSELRRLSLELNVDKSKYLEKSEWVAGLKKKLLLRLSDEELGIVLKEMNVSISVFTREFAIESISTRL